MSASWPGNMRGPRIKTLLLLLLLLLTTLTGTVLCEDEDDGAETETLPNAETEQSEEHEFDASSTSTPTSTDSSVDPDNVEGSSGMDSRAFSPEISDTVTEDPSLASSTVTMPGEEEKEEEEEEGLSATIILIPVGLVVVIIAIIVGCIVIKRRWNKKAGNQDLRKEDPYLDGPSTEKVPMPMFEEDVPSVLELEMEELDQWMKKDGETAEDSKQALA